MDVVGMVRMRRSIRMKRVVMVSNDSPMIKGGRETRHIGGEREEGMRLNWRWRWWTSDGDFKWRGDPIDRSPLFTATCRNGRVQSQRTADNIHGALDK